MYPELRGRGNLVSSWDLLNAWSRYEMGVFGLSGLGLGFIVFLERMEKWAKHRQVDQSWTQMADP